MTQQQTNAQGQRVVAVELQPAKDGATGTLVLPFGLSVSKPVALAIGDAALGKPQAFSTCLQAGCLVPLNFGKAEVTALRAGAALTAAAGTLAGSSVTASISLKGFTTAIDRTQELSRQEGAK